jgi:hypothetical protein
MYGYLQPLRDICLLESMDRGPTILEGYALLDGMKVQPYSRKQKSILRDPEDCDDMRAPLPLVKPASEMWHFARIANAFSTSTNEDHHRGVKARRKELINESRQTTENAPFMSFGKQASSCGFLPEIEVQYNRGFRSRPNTRVTLDQPEDHPQRI